MPKNEDLRTYVTPGGVSHHLDRSKNFNERHIGLGIEQEVHVDGPLRWSVKAQSHPNSYGRRANALLGAVNLSTPQDGGLYGAAGLGVGATTGYGGVKPVVLPRGELGYAAPWGNVALEVTGVPPGIDGMEPVIAGQVKVGIPTKKIGEAFKKITNWLK